MKTLFIYCALFFVAVSAAQENNHFDKKLSQSLGADAYGMKTYVFCLLKTGTNTTATKEEKEKLFSQHLANIHKLSSEGKLVVAGPFMKNDKNYRGLFVFNVDTIEAAQKLVESDPAVQAKIFEAELTLWYSSAALQQISSIHEKIAQTKF